MCVILHNEFNTTLLFHILAGDFINSRSRIKSVVFNIFTFLRFNDLISMKHTQYILCPHFIAGVLIYRKTVTVKMARNVGAVLIVLKVFSYTIKIYFLEFHIIKQFVKGYFSMKTYLILVEAVFNTLNFSARLFVFLNLIR